VAFSPDGRLAASGSWDHTARIWELESGREVRRFEGHSHRISSVAFSADGRQVFSGSWDGTARLWDCDSGAELARFGKEGTGMVHYVAISPDGRHAAWGGSPPTFPLCDLATGEEVRRFEVPVGPVRSLKFSPDGLRLLSGSGQVVLSGEGRDNGTVCLWDVPGGKRLWGWADATEPVLSVAIDAAGILGFSSTGWPSRSRLNVTRVWDLESGRETGRYEAHRQPVFSGAFLPDGRHALLGSRDRLLRLWDLGEQREVHRFEGHTDAVYSVAVSPDGRFALSGSGDRTVRYWRLPGI
jgi:WD40 repeat protein